MAPFQRARAWSRIRPAGQAHRRSSWSSDRPVEAACPDVKGTPGGRTGVRDRANADILVAAPPRPSRTCSWGVNRGTPGDRTESEPTGPSVRSDGRRGVRPFARPRRSLPQRRVRDRRARRPGSTPPPHPHHAAFFAGMGRTVIGQVHPGVPGRHGPRRRQLSAHPGQPLVLLRRRGRRARARAGTLRSAGTWCPPGSGA